MRRSRRGRYRHEPEDDISKESKHDPQAARPRRWPGAAASGVSGNLKSIGSDTLNNLMTLWAEGFRSVYPNVKIEIEGKGSGTAPPALIAGTAQFGRCRAR
jgi:ABC-type phosphate transport system substrate-binding protein